MSDQPAASPPPRGLSSGITLSDTLLLALVPVVAQALYIAYLVGYVSAYELPVQVINVEIAAVLMASLVLILVVAGVFVYLQLLLIIAYRIGPLRRYLMADPSRRESYVYYALAPPVLLLLTQRTNVGLFITLLCIAVLVMITPGLGASTGGSRRGLPRPASQAASSEAGEIESLYLVRLIRRLGELRLLGMLYALGIVAALYFLGQSTAASRTNYYVVASTPETVVLYMTPDRYYLAELDRANRELGPGYTVREVSELGAIAIRREPVGPLEISAAPAPP